MRYSIGIVSIVAALVTSPVARAEDPISLAPSNVKTPAMRINESHGELAKKSGAKKQATSRKKQREESDAQHHRNREKAILEEIPHAATWFGSNAPDCVKRVFQFHKYRGGADAQSHEGSQSRPESRPRTIGGRDERLNGGIRSPIG